MSSTDITNILFTWEVNDVLKSYIKENLSNLTRVNLIFPTPPSDDKLLELAKSADILIGWRVKDDIKLAATKMKLFINPGTGIKHHIDFFRKLNQSRNVTLINGHGNSYFTAQHAVAMLLTLLNKIIPHHTWMVEGQWRMGDKEATSIPLRNKKVGLLGYGAINTKVHKFLSGFDIQFSILKRTIDITTSSLPDVTIFPRDKLNEFLKSIDILIIAVPETTETKNLINQKELELLAPDSIVINVSRGSVVNEDSLFKALKEKKLLGAAIDVWYEYSPKENEEGSKFPYNYPFHTLTNVILSPHRAASPFSDLKRWDEVIENIKRFHKGSTDYLNVVELEREY
ncbi:MAG: NAD(P)-dependent oxidoreductase [Candidatus Hodarchaeales archaeon]